MKHFYKFLSIVFLPLSLLAQSNYKPGYVVTLKGDTIRGLVDLRNWDSNPTVISFRTAANAGIQKFSVHDTRAFAVPGIVTYRRYICPVSLDETRPAHLVSGRDTGYKIDTVFLKELQRGKNVALYAYSDQIKTRFYVGERPDYLPTELVYRIYLDADAVGNNRGGSVSENTFLKQLFALAAKYDALDDKLTRDLQDAGYVSSDMLPVVSKINGLSKQDIEQKYSEKTSFSVFAGGGLNIAATTSGQGSSYLAGGGKNYTSFSPAIAVGINLVPNSVTGNVQLRLRLLVTQAAFNPAYTLSVTPYVPVRATFNQMQYVIGPQVLYNFYNAEKLKIYAGIGIDFARYTYSNAHFGSQNPAVSDNGIGANEPFYFNGLDNSFCGQLGVQIDRKFEIFASYSTATATTRGGYWALNTQNDQIGFVFLFGK